MTAVLDRLERQLKQHNRAAFESIAINRPVPGHGLLNYRQADGSRKSIEVDAGGHIKWHEQDVVFVHELFNTAAE